MRKLRQPTTRVETGIVPTCQANAAKRWLEARQADLLPVDYYRLAPISDMACKAVVYGLLLEVTRLAKPFGTA